MTITDLILPKRGIIVPEVPSYIKLDMAFALGEGTILGDKSRYRSHGTISGAVWADGAHGRCLDFNPATPSYVEIPASQTQLDFTSEDFSIIARVYLDSVASSNTLFARGANRVDGWLARIASAGYWGLWTNQDGTRQITYSAISEIAASTWYTLGVSRDGASVTMYKNGVDVTAFPAVHIDPATCARSSKIGVRDDLTTDPFDGKIEFFRVFGGIALPASTHLAYHNALA